MGNICHAGYGRKLRYTNTSYDSGGADGTRAYSYFKPIHFGTYKGFGCFPSGPGWESPQRYFDWLRRRDPRLLADIFEHNRLDVISMATLTAHLVDLLNAQALQQHAHPDDYLAAARLLLKKAGTAGVYKILEILGENACAELSLSSKKNLANLCKRTGRMDEAVRI